jgi:hypothetical protein
MNLFPICLTVFPCFDFNKCAGTFKFQFRAQLGSYSYYWKNSNEFADESKITIGLGLH